MHKLFLLTNFIVMNDVKMSSCGILYRNTQVKYFAVFTVKYNKPIPKL